MVTCLKTGNHLTFQYCFKQIQLIVFSEYKHKACYCEAVHFIRLVLVWATRKLGKLFTFFFFFLRSFSWFGISPPPNQLLLTCYCSGNCPFSGCVVPWETTEPSWRVRWEQWAQQPSRQTCKEVKVWGFPTSNRFDYAASSCRNATHMW